VLDIGCNEGWVTCEIGKRSNNLLSHDLYYLFLGQRWHAKKVVGVDIDSGLIASAWKRRRQLWSSQAVSISQLTSQQDEPPPRKRKRGPKQNVSAPELVPLELAHYFPASLAYSFGALPVPAVDDNEDAPENNDHIFPHNVLFRTADWVTDGVLEDEDRYDVIIA
jgi:hypothetical protein